MKPKWGAIRRSDPLARPELHGDITRCNICGEESWGDLFAWRACDELDKPIPGSEALVFVDVGHPPCHAEMEDHPRLYIEDDSPAPGAFPQLCRDCVYRRGLGCEHPHLMANGGAGLRVDVETGKGMFMCGEDGLIPIPPRAYRCKGFSFVRPARSILTLGARCSEDD